MERDEQTGLILLIAVLIFGGLLCSLGTGGGQAIGNIFQNIVAYENPPTPSIEAQLKPIQQGFSGIYLVISIVATGTALLTLIAIIIYSIARQRVPLSWCLFLLLTGAIAGALVLVARNVDAAIAAVPVPQVRFVSATYDSLIYETGALTQLGLVGGALALIGLFLFLRSVLARWLSSME